MRAVDPRVGFAELEQWPDDGRRYELYDGEVIVVPSPFPRHQRVAAHLGEILQDYERANGGLVFCVPIDIVARNLFERGRLIRAHSQLR